MNLIVQKVWGSEEIIANIKQYCGKLLWIKPHMQSSRHFHSVKDETFLCLQGTVLLELGDPTNTEDDLDAFHTITLQGYKHDAYRLKPNTVHRFINPSNSMALVVEFSTEHSDEDVTRIDPSGPYHGPHSRFTK